MAIDLEAVRRSKADRQAAEREDNRRRLSQWATQSLISKTARDVHEFWPEVARTPELSNSLRKRFILWAKHFFRLVQLLRREGREISLYKGVCLSIRHQGDYSLAAAGLFQRAIEGVPVGELADELDKLSPTVGELCNLRDALSFICFFVMPREQIWPRLSTNPALTAQIALDWCNRYSERLRRAESPDEWLIEAPEIIADMFSAMKQITPEAPAKPKWAIPFDKASKRQLDGLLDGEPWWTLEQVEAAIAEVLSRCDCADTTPPLDQQPERKKRACFDRDHQWLRELEADGEPTYHSHAKIRDKWNDENPREKVTREVVIEGTKKAKKEREAGMG